MHLHVFLFLIALFAAPSFALHESDAGVVDWHKRLIGVPTSAEFHRAPERLGRNTKSLVITATDSNVLAALDPVNGSVAWRFSYESRDNIVTFSKLRSVVTSLSGAGGSTLRSFNALNGELLLEKRLHEPENGLLMQPNNLGVSIAFGNTTRDIYTLTNGRTVHYISSDVDYSNGGEIVWSFTAEDQTAQILYSNIVPTAEAVYLVGLTSSFASYMLHITALSPTGQVLSTASVPSTISNGLEDFIVVSDTVVWLENGAIKVFALTPSLQGRPARPKSATQYEKLLDVGLGSNGMFVAVNSDGSGQVYSFESDSGTWAPTKEFEAGSPTQSFYSGGFDKDGHPYVSKVHWSSSLKAVAVEIFSPHLDDQVTGYTLPFDMKTHGMISHVAIDTANPEPNRVLGRLFVTTSTGSIQVWQQNEHVWTREEGLANINAAKFVQLPERVSVLGSESGRSEEGFVGRLVRQLGDAKDLPGYVVRFVKRFVTGSYESATSPAMVDFPPVVPPPTSSSSPSAASSKVSLPFRDAFGFRQVLVVGTTYGKVYGIDTSNGEILWSRILQIGSDGVAKARVVPVEDKMFIIKTVTDTDVDGESSGGPEVVLVARSVVGEDFTSKDGEILLFHFNALTGDDILSTSASDGLLRGIVVSSQGFNGLGDAYLLQNDETKVVVLLDKEFKAHLYPHTPASEEFFTGIIANSSLSVPLRVDSERGERRLVGYQFAVRDDPRVFDGFLTWTLSLPSGQDIQSIHAPVRDPVASIGKVLGNRTTLYKYLNPHVVLVLTAPHSGYGSASKSASSASDATSPALKHCGVYLVDSVKGSVVYQALLPTEAGGGCNVKATFTENWLVYHYYDDEYQGAGQTKGYRIVTVELYGGKEVDQKTKSSELSSFSDKMMDITAYEQSFVYPHAISAIALTSTKFGITSKDVIVANINGKIQSISRRLLDPRRPVGRKPTSEEQEELLVQYDPILADDPRKVLSHNYDVSNTRSMITHPALLESTSLVFAYGLDLFLTRVAPSNTFDVLSESFNKVQLVLTVSGLAVAILVTRPMVGRKKLREKWY